MLPHARRHNNILLPILRLPIQLLDDLLRLRRHPRLALLIIKRVRLFPMCDFREPFVARVGGVDEGDEGGEVVDDVAQHGDGRFDDFVDVFGLDLEVDDPACARESCLLCSRCEC